MHENIIATMGHCDSAELLTPLIRHEFRGTIALVSSFGSESAVLLHMVARIDRSIPVITLDTGKLFEETISYRSRLVELLGFTDVRIVEPDADSIHLFDPAGVLHAQAPDACCKFRKVDPLRRVLAGFSAWISGRKRFHGGTRADIPTLQEQDGRLKIEPLARFTADDIRSYLDRHGLPRHPLLDRGYLSIGCAPCTIAGGTADSPRTGRWAGRAKTECGIHCSLKGEPMRIA